MIWASTKMKPTLPFSKAVTHVRTGNDNGHFVLRLPNRGNFILAADATRYGGPDDKNCYWLIKLLTNGSATNVKLKNRNTVDECSDNSINLPVTANKPMRPAR